jgi:hypothetical protein
MTQLAPSAIDLEQLQRSESESLLATLISQRARLATMAEQALEANLPGIAVRCENAILNNLELVSRLLGQLVSRHEVTSRSILLTPDYLKLRAILIEELRRFPEIASRLAQRIAELEKEAANEIITRAGNAPTLIDAQPC